MPRLRYRLAIDTTSRRLASIRASLGQLAPAHHDPVGDAAPAIGLAALAVEGGHPLGRLVAGHDPLGQLHLDGGVEELHLADLLQVHVHRVGRRTPEAVAVAVAVGGAVRRGARSFLAGAVARRRRCWAPARRAAVGSASDRTVRRAGVEAPDPRRQGLVIDLVAGSGAGNPSSRRPERSSATVAVIGTTVVSPVS